jgi:hypothetical protein
MPSAAIKRPGPARRALGWTILTVPIVLFVGVPTILVLGSDRDPPEGGAGHPVITILVVWVALLGIVGPLVLATAGLAIAYVGAWQSRRQPSVIVPGTVAHVFEDRGYEGVVYWSARVNLLERTGDREVTLPMPRRPRVGETVQVSIDPRKPKHAYVVDRSIVVMVVGAFMELALVSLIVGGVVAVCWLAVNWPT